MAFTYLSATITRFRVCTRSRDLFERKFSNRFVLAASARCVIVIDNHPIERAMNKFEMKINIGRDTFRARATRMMNEKCQHRIWWAAVVFAHFITHPKFSISRRIYARWATNANDSRKSSKMCLKRRTETKLANRTLLMWTIKREHLTKFQFQHSPLSFSPIFFFSV